MEAGKIVRQVETEWDSTIDKILITLGKDFRSLQSLADALGISYQVLTYWMKNYLSVDKEDFYRERVCKSNCLKIKVKNGYRYKLSGCLHCGCRCIAGLNFITARMTPRELEDICREQGWELEESEAGFFTVSF